MAAPLKAGLLVLQNQARTHLQQRGACRYFHDLCYICCARKWARMSRSYCSFMEVRVCTQVCVSFTNGTCVKEAERVEISLIGALPVGAGLRYDSSFHIWMFSSLCSVPVPMPEGRMSPISNLILGLSI